MFCTGILITKKWNLTMISAKYVQQWADFLTSEIQFIATRERNLTVGFLLKIYILWIFQLQLWLRTSRSVFKDPSYSKVSVRSNIRLGLGKKQPAKWVTVTFSVCHSQRSINNWDHYFSGCVKVLPIVYIKHDNNFINWVYTDRQTY